MIHDYFTSILAALDLAHWRFEISDDPCEEGCLADITPIDGRRMATLRLADDWRDWDSERLRTTLTHEALHLHHHDADEAIRRFFTESGDVGSYVGSLVTDQLKVNLERMVDSLSYVLAPHMPLPPDAHQ